MKKILQKNILRFFESRNTIKIIPKAYGFVGGRPVHCEASRTQHGRNSENIWYFLAKKRLFWPISDLRRSRTTTKQLL